MCDHDEPLYNHGRPFCNCGLLYQHSALIIEQTMQNTSEFYASVHEYTYFQVLKYTKKYRHNNISLNHSAIWILLYAVIAVDFYKVKLYSFHTISMNYWLCISYFTSFVYSCLSCLTFSNLSCQIPTQPLLHMVQHVADWVAPFPGVSIPLLLSTNSSIFPLLLPPLLLSRMCTRVKSNYHLNHCELLIESYSLIVS